VFGFVVGCVLLVIAARLLIGAIRDEIRTARLIGQIDALSAVLDAELDARKDVSDASTEVST
jgi:hypothetical protein